MKTTPRLTSAFHWVGGKWKLMPKLIPLMCHHVRYVSVFGGSASDILRKPPSKEEVYNDLDGDASNFFRVLQDQKARQELLVRTALTPYSRAQFHHCVELLHSKEPDHIKRAWAFFVVAHCGYSTKAPQLAGPGSFVLNFQGLRSAKWSDSSTHIRAIALRLRKVLIECRPWQQVIDRFDDEGTFFYLDPPYLWSSRKDKAMYAHEMEDAQHVELLQRLKTIKGFAMLSGYPSPLYDKVLDSWRRIEFKTFCFVSSNAKRPQRTEVVWLNYDQQGRKLHSNSDTEKTYEPK